MADKDGNNVHIIQNREPGEILLHLLPHKLSSHRYKKFIEKCNKNHIPVTEVYGNKVTHIISELDSVDDVLNRLGLSSHEFTRTIEDKLFLKTQYLSECLKRGKVVDAGDTHFLIIKDKDAIEVLEKEADLNGGDLNYSRSLAFRRCIAVLKAYPNAVRRISEVKKLPHVGEHCQKVIKELLEDGKSEEIIQISESELHTKMKMFTSVFGVGVATARKWIDYGLCNLSEVTTHLLAANIHDERVIFGIAYYDDLSLPVLKCEADFVVQLVKQEVIDLLPDATVILAGGFRRGKEEGHDIDILISHPEEGKELGLLPQMLQILDDKGLILYGKYDKRSDTTDKLKHTPKGQYLKSSHDEFEKWYGILRLNTDIRKGSTPMYNLCKQVDKTTQPQNQCGDSSKGSAYTKLKQLPGRSDNSSDKHSHGKDSSESKVTVKNSFGKRDLGSVHQSADSGGPPRKVRREAGDQTLVKVVEEAGRERVWRARRVDLVVTPASQYYYALVGWTGSKFFNRDLRLYAQRKLGMKLSSHALWDSKDRTFLTASSEEEVFENLKLQYREPWQRNA